MNTGPVLPSEVVEVETRLRRALNPRVRAISKRRYDEAGRYSGQGLEPRETLRRLKQECKLDGARSSKKVNTAA
jgi:hypothetical protein